MPDIQPLNDRLLYEAKQLYENKQFAEAFTLYTQLAENGYNPAKIFLGWMYSEGVGTVRNNESALYWFKKAAESKSPEGMFYCGLLLEQDGKDTEAFDFIYQSASTGYGPALCRLGLMYLIGRGVNVNHDFAIQYLRRAAGKGNVFAKRELAVYMIKNPKNQFDRVIGGLKFVLAVAESFVIALRNRYSEKIKC